MPQKKTLIPFGPQHPVLPEPIQLKLTLEDEKVVDAVPAIGYIHRGLEKLAETKDFLQNVFLIERICGICSFQHSMGYCMALEEILGVDVPPRALYLRLIWTELHRIHSHLLWLGLFADAFGYENLFMQAWRVREQVLDVLEATAGARIMLGTCCIGGVRRDIPPEGLKGVLRALDHLEEDLRVLTPVFLEDRTIRSRTEGVGILSAHDAHKLGAVGPVARASGIPFDLRAVPGYGVYGELGVEPQVETGGDCHARTKVRLRELTQSIDLIRRAIARIPESSTRVDVAAATVSPPAGAAPNALAASFRGNPQGEAIIRLEQPRGEVLYYVRGNGSKILDRVRVRTPTFANIPAMLAMLPGSELADVPVIVLTIDPCISCTER